MRSLRPVALLVLLAASLLIPTLALAQAAYAEQVVGFEVFPQTPLRDGRVIGATFVGRATGTLPGAVGVSVCYTGTPGHGTNAIVDGYWSLSVLQEGKYAGTLWGKSITGAVIWTDPLHATVSAKLPIVGGTGRYFRATGFATFSDGWLSHVGWPPYPPAWGGLLTVNLD